MTERIRASMQRACLTKAGLVDQAGAPADLVPMIELFRDTRHVATVVVGDPDVDWTAVPLNTVCAAVAIFAADSAIVVADAYLKVEAKTAPIPEHGALAAQYAADPSSAVRMCITATEVSADHEVTAMAEYHYTSDGDGLHIEWVRKDDSEFAPRFQPAFLAGAPSETVQAVREGMKMPVPSDLHHVIGTYEADLAAAKAMAETRKALVLLPIQRRAFGPDGEPCDFFDFGGTP